MEASSDIHWRTIRVTASKDCLRWNWTVSWCVNPLSWKEISSSKLSRKQIFYHQTSLLANENFVMQNGLFSASISDVKTAMASVNLSWSQAAFVMSASNVKWFASGLISSQNSSCWYMTVARCNPSESSARKKLEVGLEDLKAVVRDIASLFRWNYFCRDHVTFVESSEKSSQLNQGFYVNFLLLPSNINWSSVWIISSVDSSACWHALMNRRVNPVMT